MEEKVLEKDQGIQIDLKRLGALLLSKLWLVILVPVLCAVLALAGTWMFVAPKYQTTVMFYVNNSVKPSGGTITTGDMSAARGLVQSYAIILNTRETLNEVVDFADVDRTYSEVQGMIETEAVEDTEILKVVITGTSPEEVKQIAEAITQVLPERSKEIIEGSSVKIVTGASLPSSPSSPSYPKSVIIGFAIGLVGIIAFIAIQDVCDTTIRGEEDAARVGDQTILVSVPDMELQKKRSRYYNYKMDKSKLAAVEEVVTIGPGISFAASEAYKLLRTKLLLSFADDRNCRVVGVTSSLAGEGKSLTAVNLAYSMSQLGKRVLLIDCDMRRPSVAEKMNIKETPGLSDFLSGQTRADTLIQLCGIQGEESAFHIITAGRTPPNPMELLSSKKMEKTIAQLRSNYDYIILDLPPVGEVGDSLVVAGMTDGMLMVVRQDYCDRVSLGHTLRQLAFADCRILGTVFNGSGEPLKGKYYKYSKKYYGYYKSAQRAKHADEAVEL